MTTQRQNVGTVAAGRNATLAGTPLLLVGVALAAANLRPAITSMGALLGEVRADLGASEVWASVLTAVPTICFGLAAAAAPLLARRFGLARAVATALVVLTSGLVLRVLDGPWVALGGTFVAASGIAVGNVLIPVVVKQAFPQRVGPVTAVYTASLMVGGALGGAATPQLENLLGDWRITLAVWALLGVAALLVWGVGTRHTELRSANQLAAQEGGSLLRNRLAWMITLFFGLQALASYVVIGWTAELFVSDGISRSTAGLLLGLLSVAALPVTMVVPPLALRRPGQSGWIVGLVLLQLAGALGLLIAPTALPWLWAALIGAGMAVFPLGLGVLAMRARTAADTSRLSAMSQGIGYMIASVGPFLFGLLHEHTGSWTVPLIMLVAVLCADMVFGFIAGRPRYV
jgi:MFS transporter, CP family, cyanate transporter